MHTAYINSLEELEQKNTDYPSRNLVKPSL